MQPSLNFLTLGAREQVKSTFHILKRTTMIPSIPPQQTTFFISFCIPSIKTNGLRKFFFSRIEFTTAMGQRPQFQTDRSLQLPTWSQFKSIQQVTLRLIFLTSPRFF